MSVTFVATAGGEDQTGSEDLDLGDAADAAELRFEDVPLPAAEVTPSLVSNLASTNPVEGGSLLSALSTEKPAVTLARVLPSLSDGLATRSGGGPGGSDRGSSDRGAGTNRLPSGATRTGVFGAIGEGRKFVYVFDRSGSMDGHGGAPLSAAKKELIASLDDLGSTHQFQIIFYNEQPRVFNPTGTPGRLVFGTEQNKYLAQKFVGSITADGATRHEEALEMAIKMGADVIFFLTDADEPRLTAKQLARVAQLNRGTAINAIEFGYGAQSDPDDFLVQLARQNGGQHVYVDISLLPGKRR